MKKYLLLFIIIVCISAAFIIFYEKNRYPETNIMLPKDYIGWVVITFDQSGLPATKREGSRLIYEIPPSGQLKTSSKNFTGPLYCYYINDNGKKTKIEDDMCHVWGTGSGALNKADGTVIVIPETLMLFIGNEETWEQERQHPPNNSN